MWVGVVWFGSHVLQLVLIRFTRRNLRCVSKPTVVDEASSKVGLRIGRPLVMVMVSAHLQTLDNYQNNYS